MAMATTVTDARFDITTFIAAEFDCVRLAAQSAYRVQPR
jgi:hypothetical protein